MLGTSYEHSSELLGSYLSGLENSFFQLRLNSSVENIC
jgi:hypothetical protein